MSYFKVLISDILRSFPRCVIYCPLHTVQGIETIETNCCNHCLLPWKYLVFFYDKFISFGESRT